MPAEVRFARRHWEKVLPPEVNDGLAGIPEADLSRWDLVPELHLPAILKTARGKFWAALRNGRDTTDLDSWKLSPAEAGEFLDLASRDPTVAKVVLSLPRDITEAMGQFYEVLLKESVNILQEPNVLEGALQTKLVEAKARMFSNVKHQVDAFVKLSREAESLLAKKTEDAPEALPEPGPDEDFPEAGPDEGVIPDGPPGDLPEEK